MKERIVKIDCDMRFLVGVNNSITNKYIRLLDGKALDKIDVTDEISNQFPLRNRGTDRQYFLIKSLSDLYLLRSYAIGKIIDYECDFSTILAIAVISGLFSIGFYMLSSPIALGLSAISSFLSLKMISKLFKIKQLHNCKVITKNGLCIDFQSHQISNGIKF